MEGSYSETNNNVGYVPISYPHSDEMERACLGAMLEDNLAVEIAVETLNSADFFIEENKIIFMEIKGLYESGVNVDIVSVQERLNSKNELGKIGGTSYLVSLTESVSAVSSIKYYCDVIKKHSRTRALYSSVLSVYDEKEPDKIIEKLNMLVAKSANTDTGGAVSMSTTIVRALERYDKIESGQIKPIQTADYPQFNNMFWIEKGEFTVIGGQPGQGKTLFAFELCQSLARNKHRVLFLSLEMTEVELAYRLLSFRANVPLNSLRRGRCNKFEMERILTKAGELETYPIQIDPQAGLTVSQAYYKICSWAKRGAEVVFLDHIHQMSPDSGETKDHRFYERVSNMLRLVAKEKNIQVFGISQLNKSAGSRTDGPAMEDLRESGALMQDAQNIWMVTSKSNPESRELEVTVKSVKSRSDLNHIYRIGFDFKKGVVYELENHAQAMQQKGSFIEYNQKED